ncbi:MAG: hypothetical protein A2V78_00260 [Betaproteobacteria bacterium RBG_16_64_18]|nr:MAG: hypothetical protein A2V78_00260 [Betaproteobacteria bacterium RBG_16_64_18]OGA14003.1 MAG: hypothetical protein A3H33_11140 [Betaproteobacteria bacterium RIFCSPLOWO2_02_FULL_65_20]OGA43046.1 MAG: hypothetical protein A3G26_09005 [Betaproteobacteria bacterium RIFCSPLOWO2_12_FULL_65_110]
MPQAAQVTRAEFVTRTEFDRFVVLFDRLAQATDAWIEQTPKDKLDWVPVDNPNVRFGDRVSLVTIKSLYTHVAVEEYHRMRFLKDCDDGATVPIPKDPALAARLVNGDLVREAAIAHEEAMTTLRSFTDAQLQKTVRFSGRTWTMMEFLWAMYAHRAYHLGNIDIYLRQSDTPAPNFFNSIPAAN